MGPLVCGGSTTEDVAAKDAFEELLLETVDVVTVVDESFDTTLAKVVIGNTDGEAGVVNGRGNEIGVVNATRAALQDCVLLGTVADK